MATTSPIQNFFKRQLTREKQAVRRIKNRFRNQAIAGVAAVEFALILPLMLLIYSGSAEITTAISAQRRVFHLASSVGDLIGREKEVTRAGLDNVLNLSTSLMAPFSPSETTMTVASFTVDAAGNLTREWTHSRNGTLSVDTASVPAFLRQPNTSFIASGARYIYRPSLGQTIFPSYTFERFFYSRPRSPDPVLCTNC